VLQGVGTRCCYLVIKTFAMIERSPALHSPSTNKHLRPEHVLLALGLIYKDFKVGTGPCLWTGSSAPLHTQLQQVGASSTRHRL
jgi:hypothetical protein